MTLDDHLRRLSDTGRQEDAARAAHEADVSRCLQLLEEHAQRTEPVLQDALARLAQAGNPGMRTAVWDWKSTPEYLKPGERRKDGPDLSVDGAVGWPTAPFGGLRDQGARPGLGGFLSGVIRPSRDVLLCPKPVSYSVRPSGIRVSLVRFLALALEGICHRYSHPDRDTPIYYLENGDFRSVERCLIEDAMPFVTRASAKLLFDAGIRL